MTVAVCWDSGGVELFWTAIVSSPTLSLFALYLAVIDDGLKEELISLSLKLRAERSAGFLGIGGGGLRDTLDATENEDVMLDFLEGCFD